MFISVTYRVFAYYADLASNVKQSVIQYISSVTKGISSKAELNPNPNLFSFLYISSSIL